MWIPLLLTLWVFAGLASSSHLLLRYRQPTAAVGWLCAIWLLPALGVLFYALFAVYEGPRGIRRRRRLSARLRASKERGSGRAGNRDAEMREQVAEGSGALPMTAGNRVELHANASAARRAVLAAVRTAEREVLLESFIWTTDDFTAELTEELVACVGRGVDVRILVDAIGSRTTRGRELEVLRRAGIRAEHFMPLNPLKGRFQINYRNHRKLLVVDGQHAILGGRNYDEHYFDDGPEGYRDLSVRVTGPAVLALRRVVAEDWAVATEDSQVELDELPLPDNCGSVDLRVLPHGCDEVGFAYHAILSWSLRSARTSILMVTPYFVPEPSVLFDLRMAALAGVRVRLLIPAKSPERWPDLAARRYFDELLALGVEIYRRPAPFLHAKAIVIDDCRSLIGSANFDQRSSRLNYELTCEVEGAEFARQLTAYFEPDIGVSEPIDRAAFAGRGRRERLLENAAALFAPIL